MDLPARKGITRIVWATFYSYKGIIAAYRNEAAFRQELTVVLVLLPVAF